MALIFVLERVNSYVFAGVLSDFSLVADVGVKDGLILLEELRKWQTPILVDCGVRVKVVRISGADELGFGIDENKRNELTGILVRVQMEKKYGNGFSVVLEEGSVMC